MKAVSSAPKVLIWMNGEMVDWPEAKLHVLSHGLHYASCVFEGERVYGGEVFKLTEHTERLHESARVLGFTIPYSVAEIDQACRNAASIRRPFRSRAELPSRAAP